MNNIKTTYRIVNNPANALLAERCFASKYQTTAKEFTTTKGRFIFSYKYLCGINPKLTDMNTNEYKTNPNTSATATNECVFNTEDCVISSNDYVLPSNERVLVSNDCVLLAEERVLLSNERVLLAEDCVLPSNERVLMSKDRVLPSKYRVNSYNKPNISILNKYLTIKNLEK